MEETWPKIAGVFTCCKYYFATLHILIALFDAWSFTFQTETQQVVFQTEVLFPGGRLLAYICQLKTGFFD